MAMAALGGAAALFGGGDKPAAPPPVAMPTPAPTARTPGADVKIGDGAEASGMTSTPDYAGFTEKRTFGKPLGGLGKGGLGL